MISSENNFSRVKKSALLLGVFCLSFTLQAQEESAKEKKANEAFEAFAYDKAIEMYNQLDEISLDTKRKKAISYWKLHDSNAAESVFYDIVNTEGHTADDLYDYAAVLRENKKYSEAEEWMRKYAQVATADSRGKLYSGAVGQYMRLGKEDRSFRVKNLDINSEQQDFAATFYKNKVFFASSREPGVRPIRRKWNRNHLSFLDIYVADRDETNNLSNVNPVEGEINRKFHEGPVAFNPAGDVMFFTRNNYDGKSAEGYVRLQLFMSNLVDGKWAEPVGLPFNNNEYSVGHPTVSKDGEWLYFASNMPGGLGGVDIYRAKINTDGTFGEPANLGAKVNTEGDELFPYIHPNNELLFFSSDGRVGLGGLDIFLAQLRPKNDFGKIINLGAPVNSNKDDFSFVLDEEQMHGYFASNRDGGKGSDDIYGFDLSKPFSFDKTIKGTARDKTGRPLANTRITLFDLISGEELVITTGSKGTYEFAVEEDRVFNVRGQKPDYFDGTNVADTHTKEDIILVNLELEKNPGLVLLAIVTDKESGEPLDSVKITVVDNLTGKEESLVTRTSGEYKRPLTNKKLNDAGSYSISIERAGYLSKKVNYNVVFEREGNYAIHETLDLSMEPIAVGGDLSDVIDIKPIYFDVDRSRIRPDAALELDKIVKVMNDNPNMVIELGSHTDSRGSATSNESLSDRRAKASANYIKERISNPDRISGKGYGESVPNKIVLEDGTKQELSEEFIATFRSSDPEKFEALHQQNRRTEFIIIKM